ncbi:MAG: hypothetical protein AMXMBFR23_03990 [Chloroflexota bacterium]
MQTGHGPSGVRWWSWGSLGITLATIVMGAVVRATHSGDGCGRSWPACEGRLVFPGTDDTARLIEFSHRMISGINLVVVAVFVLLVFRAFTAGHPSRRAVVWTMAFLVFEAGIGAAIVLYGWVAHDYSTARQVAVPLHLVNTFLLMGALTYTVWTVHGGAAPAIRGARYLRPLAALAGVLMLIAATGATTSLADTLFAAESVAEGIRADFHEESAFLVRIRILHPIFAISGGVLLAWFAWKRLDEVELLGRPWPARLIIMGVTGQALLGVVHIALLTPLATGLLHLLIAQTLWVAFVFFALTLLEPEPGRRAV